MKKIYFYIVSTFFCTTAVAEDGYVTVDPSKVETIDGSKLMIASYIIVLGLLLSYWIYISLKTKKLHSQLSKLTQENK